MQFSKMTIHQSAWRDGIPGKLTNVREIDVWRASLELSTPQNKSLLDILSKDEVHRARRFHFKKDHDRFISARGTLRRILGSYLGERPEKIRFRYSSQGKPMLAGNADLDTLYFNLSHSNALAIYAITQNKNIGIDIEHIKDDIATEQVAQKFFSHNEMNSLNKVPEKKRKRVFYQYWTRKEALLKATGKGISFPMDQFDVSLINGMDLSSIKFPQENKRHPHLYVQYIDPDENYVAAIAIEGNDKDISLWKYIH